MMNSGELNDEWSSCILFFLLYLLFFPSLVVCSNAWLGAVEGAGRDPAAGGGVHGEQQN